MVVIHKTTVEEGNLIVVLRLLAAYYHWSLPKSDYHDEPQTTTAAQTNQDSEIPQ